MPRIDDCSGTLSSSRLTFENAESRIILIGRNAPKGAGVSAHLHLDTSPPASNSWSHRYTITRSDRCLHTHTQGSAPATSLKRV